MSGKAKVKDSLKNTISQFRDLSVQYQKNKDLEVKKQLDKINEEINNLSLGVKKAGAVRVPSDGPSKNFRKSDQGRTLNAFLMKGGENLSSEQKSTKVKLHPSLEAKAMVTYDGTSGGFLSPPPEFVGEIDKEVIEFAPIWGMVRKRPSTTSGLLLSKRNGIPTAYWKGEGEELTKSQSAYEEDEIPVHELTASTVATTRQMENPVFNIEGEIVSDQGEAFGVAIAQAIMNGNGVNKPKGMIGNVNQYASGSLSLTHEILAKFPSKLKEVYRRNAVWLGNRETFGVIRTILASDSATFMLWAQTLAEGRPEMLVGRPIAEAPELPAPQADGSFVAGQVPLMLGDYNRGYTAADCVELRIQRNPFRISNKVIFETYRYVGGKVTRKEAITELDITAP